MAGGKAMADWLRTSYPNLKILFTSGYTDETITGWGLLQAGAEFLPKPYSSATLVCKVRQMLDKSHSKRSHGKSKKVVV